MSQADTAREALRLRSVGELIQGKNIQSEIALRESSGALNRQQAANLRAAEPHIAREILARIATSETQAEENRAQTQRIQTLTPAELASTQALTKQRLDENQRQQELLQYQKRNIDANITQSLAAAGASNTNAEIARKLFPLQYKELENKNNEYVQLEMQGQKFTAKGLAVAKERSDAFKEMATLAAKQEKDIREARKDEQTMLKASTDAETKVKSLTIGGKIYKPEELIPQVNMYHATSTNPYVYIYEPGAKGFVYDDDATLKPTQLPKVGEHQYVAREVYDAAAARSMTVQEYLEKVFYPSLRMPVPWKTTPEPK